MCKPASFIVTKDKVFFSNKSDSHEEIIKEFGLHEGSGRINFVRIEITPPKNNLSLSLDKWEFKLDQTEFPDWFEVKECEKNCRIELKKWAKVRLSGWKVKEAFNPIHPLKIKAKKISEKELKKLVKEWSKVRVSVWDSVGDSVWDSVWDSVGASVRDSVWDSVWDSVRASVGASVGDSVWASVGASVGDSVRASVGASVDGYIGSLFPNIKKWKYTNITNPWKSIRKLWISGYVPSFDGKILRLHSGEKAEVVYSWKKEEIKH